MKITKIKFKDDDPILKGLTLDFTRIDGSAYENVVLVGENGIGKTTIMNRIAALFHDESFIFDTFEYIEDGNTFIAKEKDGDTFQISKNGNAFEDVHITHKYGENNSIGWHYVEMDEKPNNRNLSYSPAVSDFRNDDIKSDIHDKVLRYLTTIQQQDYEQYYSHNSDNEKTGSPLVTVTWFNSHVSQMQRFKNAYNQVFEGLEFDGLHTDADRTRVLFIKDGIANIDIEALSTGEKQVVFRGSYLLSRALNTSVALIDEPEISMHPCWQDKILDFYKSLYYDVAANQQVTQLFFATHSDIVLTNAVASASDTKVLILKKGADGSLSCNNPQERVLPSLTIAETNYIIFKRYTTDYCIELFSLLHANIQNNRGVARVFIKEVDDSIKKQAIYGVQYAKTYENVHTPGNITRYDTLPCYVRNSIDHPRSKDSHGVEQVHTAAELRMSIDFLRELIKLQNTGVYDYTI